MVYILLFNTGICSVENADFKQLRSINHKPQTKIMKKEEEDFDASLAGEEGTEEQIKANWFKRMKKGILTSTKDKKDAPEGLWSKCPSCKYTCTISELGENKFVCPSCDYHHRIGSAEYFEILFDDNHFFC